MNKGKTMKIILALILAPSLAFACLAWDAPTVDYAGAPLVAPIEEYIVYVGSVNDPSQMLEVARIATTTTGSTTCQSLGYTPNKYACVKARYAAGVSECSDVLQHLPPGKAKNLKVE